MKKYATTNTLAANFYNIGPVTLDAKYSASEQFNHVGELISSNDIFSVDNFYLYIFI